MLRTSAPLIGTIGVRFTSVWWISLTINSQLVARRLKKLVCFAICSIGGEQECRESESKNGSLAVCAHGGATLKPVEEKAEAQWLIESQAASARLTPKA